jgi:hypothetical protein
MKGKHRTFFYRIVTLLILLIFLASIIGVGISLIY